MRFGTIDAAIPGDSVTTASLCIPNAQNILFIYICLREGYVFFYSRRRYLRSIAFIYDFPGDLSFFPPKIIGIRIFFYSLSLNHVVMINEQHNNSFSYDTYFMECDERICCSVWLLSIFCFVSKDFGFFSFFLPFFFPMVSSIKCNSNRQFECVQMLT